VSQVVEDPRLLRELKKLFGCEVVRLAPGVSTEALRKLIAIAKRERPESSDSTLLSTPELEITAHVLNYPGATVGLSVTRYKRSGKCEAFVNYITLH
jgi:hypothetical protein